MRDKVAPPKLQKSILSPLETARLRSSLGIVHRPHRSTSHLSPRRRPRGAALGRLGAAKATGRLVVDTCGCRKSRRCWRVLSGTSSISTHETSRHRWTKNCAQSLLHKSAKVMVCPDKGGTSLSHTSRTQIHSVAEPFHTLTLLD